MLFLYNGKEYSNENVINFDEKKIKFKIYVHNPISIRINKLYEIAEVFFCQQLKSACAHKLLQA